MGVLLFVIARILQWVLSPLFFVYAILRLRNLKKISKYFHDVALSIDQLGNTMGAPIMNDLLIKKEGYKFGNPDDTISFVLGKNYPLELTWLGYALALLLNFIDKDHVQKAVNNNQ